MAARSIEAGAGSLIHFPVTPGAEYRSPSVERACKHFTVSLVNVGWERLLQIAPEKIPQTVKDRPPLIKFDGT
jgi:hypothetical protein